MTNGMEQTILLATNWVQEFSPTTLAIKIGMVGNTITPTVKIALEQ